MKRGLLIIAGSAAIFFGSAARSAADDGNGAGNSQLFSPARYVVTAAEINVRMRDQQNRKTQKVLLRLDTQTGEAMILQLSVVSGDDPTVLSAVWAPVIPASRGIWNGNGASGI